MIQMIFGIACLMSVHLYAQPPVASNMTQSLDIYAQILYYLEMLYVDPNKIDKSQLIENSIKGMLSSLDPHTTYMSVRDYKELKTDTSGKFGGVGIRLNKNDNKLTVSSCLEDAPAMKAGIQSGDVITQINDVVINEQTFDSAIDQLRGDVGTSLTIKILRGKLKKTFTLVRELIKSQSVTSEEIHPQILYISISSFQDTIAKQVQTFITEYQQKKTLKGLILDLRDNPGGLLNEAVELSDLFLESGVIVSTVGRDPNQKDVEFAHKKDTFAYFPMVVIINEGSASASEIVAGALQDHKRALIIGKTSFGKGSVQTMIDLPGGNGLKMTIARYYTPLNRSIQAKGIIPDIIIPERLIEESTDKHTLEKDLKGHFEAVENPLPQSMAQQFVKKLPSPHSDDYQLLSAINHLMSITIFSDKEQSSSLDP